MLFRSEYLEIQKFGSMIATMVGLGAAIYDEIYIDNQEEVNKILKAEYTGPDTQLDRDAEAMERKAKYRKRMEEIISETIRDLPDSNYREMENSMGKFSLGKLMNVYGAAINNSTLESINAFYGDSLFNGLCEESYYAQAEQNRQTLEIKQEMVPTSGYSTRQFYDLCQPILYNASLESKDKYGILLKEEDAIGRKVIKKVKRGKENWVRVVSCATNNHVKYNHKQRC